MLLAGPMRTGSTRTGSTSTSAMRLGIRGRVLLAVLVVVIIAQLGSVLVLRQVLVTALDKRVDEILAREAAELRQLAGGVDPETGEPFGDDVRAIFDVFFSRSAPDERETFVSLVDGEVHRASRAELRLDDTELVRRVAQLRAPRRDQAQTSQGRVDYLAVPLLGADGAPDGVFVVLYDYQGERAEIDDALRRVEVVALIFFLLAAAVGWVASARAVAPVRRLTATAHTIGSGRDLGHRLPEISGRDEVATLTRTFNAMFDRLETAFVVQRDFIADAGHELRTPITIVRGHLEGLSGDPLEQRETIELVTGELDRMTRMVEDLLTLAKMVRPDFLHVGPVHVRPLLDQVCMTASVLGDRTWTVSGAPDTMVVADRQRLTQALMELATNAFRHTRSGGGVTLGGAVAKEQLYLWVSDDGVGVPAGDYERIFERFARASARRSRERGSGLGLAIVSAIAEAHGGKAHVMSTERVGSAFVLTLNLVTSPQAAEQDAGS